MSLRKLFRAIRHPTRYCRFAVKQLKSWTTTHAFLLLNVLSRNTIRASEGPVVCLTSYGTRVQTVYLAIESIARGSVRPSRIVLWLEGDQRIRAIPSELLRLQKRGLEIAFSDGTFGPHTKYYPYVTSDCSLTKPLVTADDDVLYPKEWLKGLFTSYQSDPSSIHCYQARVVSIRTDGLGPYSEWHFCESTQPSFRHCAMGVCGVLYPPAFLIALKSAGTRFMECCPRADDLWLHHQATLSGYKVRQLSKRGERFRLIDGTQAKTLFSHNVFEFGNDIQAQDTYSHISLTIILNSIG